MAEAIKIEGDGVIVAADEGGPAVDRADGGAYTASDRAQFEKLSNLSRVAGSPVGTPGPRGADADRDSAAIPCVFGYTDADTRAFDHLMDQLKGHRGKGRPATASKGSPGLFGYTDRDDRLFADMMPPERGPGQAVAPQISSAAPESKDSVFQYSRQDNAAFQKIMPEISGEGDLRRDEDATLRSRSDRDVGTIRIIDFDKEHARDKESRRRGNPKIKIRYFD